MSGEKGATFPIAALSIVALLVSAGLVSQHAFDLLRLAESDAARQGQRLLPPVEARLWEDPLAAMARHRTTVKARCDALEKRRAAAARPKEEVEQARRTNEGKALAAGGVGAKGETAAKAEGAEAASRDEQLQPTKVAAGTTAAAEAVPSKQDGANGAASTSRKDDHDPMCDGDDAVVVVPKQADRTVIAALLPGTDFLGVEEMRRRVRYAILAGLAAEGFVPQYSERISFLRGAPCNKFVECQSDAEEIDVPYETLRTETKEGRKHVVVLWINDVAIGKKWLRRIAALLDKWQLNGELRIFGPHDSDKLQDAFEDIGTLTDCKTRRGESQSDKFNPICGVLEKATLVSPWSTTPGELLMEAVMPDSAHAGTSSLRPAIDAVEIWFRRQLGIGRSEPFFVRSIGTDDKQVELLARELRARGLMARETRRVVVLREWDSVYARSFTRSLKDKLESFGSRNFRAYSYLRGLDGASLDGATKDLRLVSRRGDDKERKEPPLEWPETRDQRDYVRRLAGEIRRQADREDAYVAAIGIIGTEVHDKLILAQALREVFPDKVLFTTDLDVRLMHPEVLHYTRNMVVASSLPLEPPRLVEEEKEAGVAPFRDSYQTAAYLGARYAVAPERLEKIQRVSKDGFLFEIGRHGVVKLKSPEQPKPEDDRRGYFFWASTAVLAVLAWFIVWGLPGPAMREALKPDPQIPVGAFRLSTAVLCGLTMASLGFATGVVAELGSPGTLGPGRILLLAGLAPVFFFAFVYPGIRPLSGELARQLRDARPLLRALLVLLVGVGGWLCLPPSSVDPEMREPFAVAKGVSAWPSELLRTLAVVLFPWFLDRAWNGTTEAARDIGERYFGVDFKWWLPQADVGTKPSREKRLSLFRNKGLWIDSGSVSGHTLGSVYFFAWRKINRFLFLVLGFMATVLLVGLLVELLGGQWPGTPARGLDDRSLFIITNALAVTGAIVLLVLVTHATLLTWRFILIMREGRTIYPDATVMRTARELGLSWEDEQKRALYYPIAASPADRGTRSGHNSLFDPWIDARLLARHTKAINPLIMFPLVLLTLLIMARGHLFDNWGFGVVIVVLSGYLLWAVAMAVLLNLGAEAARRRAVFDLEKDLLWLKGKGPEYKDLTEQFPKVIEQVRELREGAFAPFFEQPLVHAIMVVMGGCGIQVLETYLLASR